jgi:hypothetical protein
MRAERQAVSEEQALAEYEAILANIHATTPHVAFNLGVGETVVLISTIQLALRHPGYRERSSSKVAANICHMLIEGLAARDERIRPILEMGFDERFDR